MILIINTLFCHKNQRNMLQVKTKEWIFEAYLLTEETSCWFQLIESLKMTCAWSVLDVWFLNFLDVFRGMSCPNSAKQLLHVQSQQKKTNMVFKFLNKFWLAQSLKNEYQLWIPTAQSLTSLKIYIYPVMEKLETSNLDSR